ncbi:MAG TPA: ABC transporter substrate-binding protein [Hyphomicrobiales bacterium]|nr:ABC transporter substrate-binding protein [Hyphomicrobiales bacterium]
MKFTMASWGATAAAAALGLALAAGPAAAQNKPDFKVGVVASLTGPFASPSKDTIDGVNAWIKVHGLKDRKLVLDVLDDETNPVTAANVFRRLAADPAVKLIYMFGNSNSGLAIKSFASEYKVPIITGGGADTLGYPADPWDFKVAPSNADNMKAISLFAKAKGYTRIAHIYGTDSYGQLDHKNLVIQAKANGLDLVASESFAIEDTNFNAQLARIKAANPQLVYSSAAGRAAALVFKTYKLLGIKAPLLVTQAAVTNAFWQAIGGTAQGNGLLVGAQLSAYGTALGGPTAKYFTELKDAIGHTPPYFATFGYDVGIMTGAAVDPSDGSRQSIRDHLEALHDLPAMNGPINYSAKDHTGQSYRSIKIGRFENGVAVPAE